MSIENHPNINAAGFTDDMLTAFFNHLRGRANLNASNRADAADAVINKIQDLAVNISEQLDQMFGI